MPQKRGVNTIQIRGVRGLAAHEGTFEHQDGLVEFPLLEIQHADAMTDVAEAVWLIDRLGNPEPCFSVGDPLGELPTLCQTADQPAMG
jgi:hypothetical protein